MKGKQSSKKLIFIKLNSSKLIKNQTIKINTKSNFQAKDNSLKYTSL